MKLSYALIVSAMCALTSTTALAEGDSRGTGLFLEPGVTYQITESNIDYMED